MTSKCGKSDKNDGDAVIQGRLGPMRRRKLNCGCEIVEYIRGVGPSEYFTEMPCDMFEDGVEVVEKIE